MCETRAAAGTAETPADPSSGLIFSFEKRFMSLAKSRPLAVAMAKEKAPMAKMARDWGRRKVSAWVLAPTVKPRRIVTMSIMGPRAVRARRSVTPLSFRMFPKKSIPSSGRAPGAMNEHTARPTMGKRIFCSGVAAGAGFIRIRRSFRVVSRRMMGGWITGTRAM